MRKQILILLGGLLILSRIYPQTQPHTGRALIYMLCDFTGSIDSAKISIIKNIKSICRQVPETDETDIKLFRVTRENAPNMLHSLSLPAVIGKKESDKMMIRGERLMSILNFSSFTEKGFGHYPTDGSCLIKSIETATENLKASKGYDKVYLLIFSDMMEECNYNGNSFNFEKRGVSDALNWIQKFNPPIKLFSEIKNLTVGIFVSSVHDSKLSNWHEFWIKWFKKNGYTKQLSFPTYVSEGWFNQ